MILGYPQFTKPSSGLGTLQWRCHGTLWIELSSWVPSADCCRVTAIVHQGLCKLGCTYPPLLQHGPARSRDSRENNISQLRKIDSYLRALPTFAKICFFAACLMLMSLPPSLSIRIKIRGEKHNSHILSPFDSLRSPLTLQSLDLSWHSNPRTTWQRQIPAFIGQ